MECIKKGKVQFKTSPVSTMLGRKVKKLGRVNLLRQCIALVETGCLTWDVPGMSDFKHQLEFFQFKLMVAATSHQLGFSCR